LAVFLHAFDVEGDGLPDRAKGFFPGLSRRDAPGEIRDERPMAALTLFENDRVFHGLSYVLSRSAGNPADLDSLKCRARTSVHLAFLTSLRARTCACQRVDEGPFIGSLVWYQPSHFRAYTRRQVDEAIFMDLHELLGE
jgi:hypothetical protein